MIEYLKWLRSYYDRNYNCREGYEPRETEIHLMLDLHSSHRKENVKQLAEELHIRLYYIPAGMTDIMQPCDIRVPTVCNIVISWKSQQSSVIYNYSLKLVITNPDLHFIAFKRINLSKSFFEINELCNYKRTILHSERISYGSVFSNLLINCVLV